MASASDFSNDDELLNQFLEYADECAVEMRGYLDKQIADPSLGMLDQLYTGAHNLKGMSGSFGFDLLTEIAALMCLYMKRNEGEADLDLLNGHLKALEVIIAHKITGDGGEKGQAILSKLKSRTSEAVGTLE